MNICYVKYWGAGGGCSPVLVISAEDNCPDVM
jgi:hypothetical protein